MIVWGFILTIVGLVLNIAGAICLASLTPFLECDEKLGAIMVDTKKSKTKPKKLYCWGLVLIVFGFCFQLLGVVLSHIK